MERSVAVKKLAKLLGPKFGYRINDKAPTPEERAAARAELPSANQKRDSLRKQMEERREAILKADAGYQELSSAWKNARQQAGKLSGKLYQHKITVGTSVGIAGFSMFSVEADGDSWEEIFAKLAEKKKAA